MDAVKDYIVFLIGGYEYGKAFEFMALGVLLWLEETRCNSEDNYISHTDGEVDI